MYYPNANRDRETGAFRFSSFLTGIFSCLATDLAALCWSGWEPRNSPVSGRCLPSCSWKKGCRQKKKHLVWRNLDSDAHQTFRSLRKVTPSKRWVEHLWLTSLGDCRKRKSFVLRFLVAIIAVAATNAGIWICEVGLETSFFKFQDFK